MAATISIMNWPKNDPFTPDERQAARRRNLQCLFDEHGGVEGLSARMDLASTMLANLLVAPESQTAGMRGEMSDSLVKRFENECLLPPGFMSDSLSDWKIPNRWQRFFS